MKQKEAKDIILGKINEAIIELKRKGCEDLYHDLPNFLIEIAEAESYD